MGYDTTNVMTIFINKIASLHYNCASLFLWRQNCRNELLLAQVFADDPDFFFGPKVSDLGKISCVIYLATPLMAQTLDKICVRLTQLDVSGRQSLIPEADDPTVSNLKRNGTVESHVHKKKKGANAYAGACTGKDGGCLACGQMQL